MSNTQFQLEKHTHANMPAKRKELNTVLDECRASRSGWAFAYLEGRNRRLLFMTVYSRGGEGGWKGRMGNATQPIGKLWTAWFTFPARRWCLIFSHLRCGIWSVMQALSISSTGLLDKLLLYKGRQASLVRIDRHRPLASEAHDCVRFRPNVFYTVRS